MHVCMRVFGGGQAGIRCPPQRCDISPKLDDLCAPLSPLPTVELHAHTAMPGFFPFFNFENFVCIYSYVYPQLAPWLPLDLTLVPFSLF